MDFNYAGFDELVRTSRISWPKATESNKRDYRCALSRNLLAIALPGDALACQDLHCTDAAHLQTIHEYSLLISTACIKAAAETIPRTCNRQNNHRMPGWSEHVRPVRERSLFWHRIWTECDRPKTGVVADTMRRTRAAYHYTIRKIKKDEENITRERVATAMLNDKSRDFWKEIKRMRRSRTCNSRIVDGQTGATNIARVFADKYSDLFSSVPYDDAKLRNIEDRIKVGLENARFDQDFIITAGDVRAAVSRLKAHKHEGDSDLSSDHVINAGPDLMIHAACLFSAAIVHGTAPVVFLPSTVIPIPKGRNVNLSVSDNFRGIALGSIFCKILDTIILERYQDQLASCDLQFGFKRNSSTNLCSMVLKETLTYYVNNHSPVYCTFLDASKAFDRINYCKLFELLMKRNIPAYITRLLINLYSHSLLRVSWSGIVTDYFAALNGVKQGAVLSPVLFCVYVDDLLIALSNAGVGCFIGATFVGALAYADDIVIVAPTATSMRKLLAICETYAHEYCILFNARKSKTMTVMPAMPAKSRASYMHFDDCIFYIDGAPIESVHSFMHLGHLITSSLADDDDIDKCCGNFNGQVNNVLCYFRKLNSSTRYELFRFYCTSFYGCELWSLDTSTIEKLCIAWRRGLRKVWNIPPQAHCYLISMISNCFPLFDEICYRSLKFVRKCVDHSSALVRFVTLHSIMNARGVSVLGRNVSFCMHRYNVSFSDIFTGRLDGIINTRVKNSYDTRMVAMANLLMELLQLRDGSLSLPIGHSLSYEEICVAINFICTE